MHASNNSTLVLLLSPQLELLVLAMRNIKSATKTGLDGYNQQTFHRPSQSAKTMCTYARTNMLDLLILRICSPYGTVYK